MPSLSLSLGLGNIALLRGASGPDLLAPYLGQASNRTYFPDFVNTTNKQMRGRSMHYAYADMVNPTFRFPNIYDDGFAGGATYAELGPGAASTIVATVEQPLGTVVGQITFSGLSSGSIPNALYVDGVYTGTVLKGWYGVRFFITNTAGIVFCLGPGAASPNVPGNFQMGDVLDSAVSGLTDNTAGGAYTSTSGSSRYSPILITAMTTLPSVLEIGDSKEYAENDTGDQSGACGEIERWISPFFPNAKWAIRGRDASQFNANSTVQASMSQYFTHLINEDGINGFIHGRTAAQVATDTDALAAKFPTLKKYLTTILPSPTTTDNYATLGNETAAAYAAGVITENTRRRAIPAAWLGCFDSAAAVESSLNSGLITPAQGYFVTGSSVHPTRAGYVRIAEANRSAAVAAINRNGTALTFANIVAINQFDHAEDATSQTTYTWTARNFLIGSASTFRRVVVGISARFGTTGATANSCTIGGVAATKIDEAINVTGGAETITSVWRADVPTGTTATVSATFSTAMLRAGCDVYTAVGLSALPTISTSSNNQSSTGVASNGPLTVPANGGAIIFSTCIDGSVPTFTPTGFVNVTPVTLIGGTFYYASGAAAFPGSQTYTSTWGGPTGSATGVAVVFGP